MADLLGYLLRSSLVLLAGIVLYLCFLGWAMKAAMTEKQVKHAALVGAILFWITGAVWLATGLVWVVVG